MLPTTQLTAALQGCQPQTLRATLYRAVQLSYLPTLTSTIGGKERANRYSPPELSDALYLADGPDQAMLEATRQFRRDFSSDTVPAYVIYPVTVNLSRVLDVTHDADWASLGTSLEELTGDWRSAWARVLRQQPGARVATHDLGRAAFAQGFEAIKYPSAYHPERTNIVVFTDQVEHAPQEHLPEVAMRAINWLNTETP